MQKRAKSAEKCKMERRFFEWQQHEQRGGVPAPSPSGWVGVREPRGRLGELYAKNVTICPTQACTTPIIRPTHVDNRVCAYNSGKLGGRARNSLNVEYQPNGGRGCKPCGRCSEGVNTAEETHGGTSAAWPCSIFFLIWPLF